MSTTKPRRKNYSEEQIESAIASIIKKERSIRNAAKHFNIPRSTLRDAVVKTKRGQKRYSYGPRIMTEAEEQKVKAYIFQCTRDGVACSGNDIINKTIKIVKSRKDPAARTRTVTRGWLSSFFSRHEDIIIPEMVTRATKSSKLAAEQNVDVEEVQEVSEEEEEFSVLQESPQVVNDVEETEIAELKSIQNQNTEKIVKIDKELENHLSKCRCCFRGLKSQRKSIKITAQIEEKFLKFIGIELKSSQAYSSIMCEVCKKQLDELAMKHQKFEQNQKRLYEFVGQQNDPSQIDLQQNDVNFDTELVEMDTNPFEILNIKNEEEVVVKVECFDDDDESATEEVFEEVNDADESESQKETKFLLERNVCALKKQSKSKTDEVPKKPKFQFRKVLNPKINQVSEEQLPPGIPVDQDNTKCGVCGEIFSARGFASHVRSHRKVKSATVDKYAKGFKLCPICGIKLTLSGYLKHKRRHDNILNNIWFQCDYCPYKTPLKKNLYSHMFTHLGGFGRKYYCNYCPQVFKSKAKKNLHVRKSHTHVDEKHACFCGKIFKSYCALYEHRRNEHEIGHFPCPKCDEVFTSRDRFKYHFISHKPKFPCDICGEMIPEIGRHMHQKHYRAKCTVEGCNAELPKNSLSYHMNTAHSNPDEIKKCEFCDREFNNATRLYVHIQRQHKATKKACKVPGCSHATNRKDYLRMHYRNHKGIDSDEKARLIAELKTVIDFSNY